MDSIDVINAIRKKFSETGNPAQITLTGRRYFQARLAEEGVYVNNLGDNSFLPWAVFTEAVSILEKTGGRAMKGNAMNFKLGELGLPFDSVEGRIALVVYGKKAGESVLRRITPIAGILIWAEICRSEPGELVLQRA